MISRREFIVAGAGSALLTAGCNSSGNGTAPASSNVVSPTQGAGPIALTVTITGLCGLIRTGTPFGLDVLLIDGEATLGQKHFPRLYAAPNLVDTAMTTVPPQDFTDPDGNKFNYWDLKGFQTTLSSSGGTAINPVTGVRPPGAKLPPTTSAEEDVSWMPEMTKLTPTGRARINPQCLYPDPRPAKVAGRVRFNAGKLMSRFNRGHIDFSKITFNFLPAPASAVYEQALGEAQLTDSITANRIVFDLHPFAGGGGSKQIVLKAASGGAGPVDVLLRNSFDHACASDQDVRTLSHFSAYYDLLLAADQPATPAQRPIPNASGTNLPNCFHEDEFVRCPHGTYEDVP
jgi:hypothetical protein